MQTPIVPGQKVISRIAIILVVISAVLFWILDDKDYTIFLWIWYGIAACIVAYRCYYAWKQNLKSYVWISVLITVVVGVAFLLLQLWFNHMDSQFPQ